MDRPVSTWPTAVLFWNVTVTVLPPNVLLVAAIVGRCRGCRRRCCSSRSRAWGCRWGRPRHRKEHTSLADIAASVILVAIVHHEVEAILVTWDKVKLGHVPAAFGAVALVRWGGRRHRIGAWSEVPVVRWRVSVGSDSNCGWVRGIVNCLDGTFPCPEDRIRRDRRAAKLPVARKRVPRICRHVCDVHRLGTLGDPPCRCHPGLLSHRHVDSLHLSEWPWAQPKTGS